MTRTRIQAAVAVAAMWFVLQRASGLPFRDPIPIDGGMPNSYRFVQADLNGDGRTDIVVTQLGEAQFFWFERRRTMQPEYVRHNVETPHGYGDYLSIGDLDQNGDLDIVSTGFRDWDSEYLLWRANDGGPNPTFATYSIDEGPCFYGKSVVADLDGDGDLDIVCATDWPEAACPASIQVYFNDGASPPQFSRYTYVIPSAETLIYDLEVADFDADGRPDIIFADSLSPYWDTPGEICWLRNLGGKPPSFDISQLYENPTTVFDIAVTDLDRDTDCDVVATCYGNLLWLENHHSCGDPNLTVHTIPKESGIPWSLAVADADLDEDLDLFVIYSETDRIVFYENDGASPPGFTAKPFAQPYRPVLLQPADLDNDGDLDLLSLNRGTTNLFWYENRAVVSENVVEVSPSSGSESSGREGGPFEPQKFQYTITSHSTKQSLDWYVATDANWLSIQPSQGTLGPDSAATVEVTFDETAKTLHSANYTAQIEFDQAGLDRPVTIKQVALHILSRYFDVIAEPRTIMNTSDMTYRFRIGDLNGDAVKDILSLDWSFGGFYWIEQMPKPSHQFMVHGESLVPWPSSVDEVFSIGDMDGDGDLDVLTRSSGDTSSLNWHENDGSNPPQFTLRPIAPISLWVIDDLIVDLDGDGDNDAVAAIVSMEDNPGPSLYWFENDGCTPPGFTQHLVSPDLQAKYICQLLASDLDGDGDVDLVFGTDDPPQVWWLENLSNHPLSFQRHVLPPQEGYYPAGMALGDFNKDGLQDVVVCYTSLMQFNPGRVILFENHLTDPSPHWRPVLMDESIISPDQVDVGDLDGDGDLDAFVLANFLEQDKVYYVEQLGQSTNTFAAVVFKEIYRPRYIRIDDIDQDGDQDILLQGLEDLSLYENIAADPIRLISPSGGEHFDEQASLSISWKTDVARAGSEVKIELLRKQELVCLLGYDSDPDGRNATTVVLPVLEPDRQYTVRITSTKDPSFYDESGAFTIGSPPRGPRTVRAKESLPEDVAQ
jgi:hypothetical protein